MKEKVVSTASAQGYTADGAESSLKGAVSHKECYEHGRFVNNNVPPPGELDGFKEFVDSFYQVSSNHLFLEDSWLIEDRNASRSANMF
jgi:hypothetical protein